MVSVNLDVALMAPATMKAFGRRPPNTRRCPSSGRHPKPFADSDLPGLEARSLFDFIRDDVMVMTNRKLQPFSYGSNSGRQDFYYVAAE